jgi:hypothetical protein
LDDLIDGMATRKTAFAGHVRTVPICREHPLELLEFDEIGALTKYTDRKDPGSDHRTGCSAHDAGASAGIHRAWICARTH